MSLFYYQYSVVKNLVFYFKEYQMQVHKKLWASFVHVNVSVWNEDTF